MPMYDRRCETCGAVKPDQFETMGDSAPIPCPCEEGEMIRVHLPTRRAVVGDDIPGGLLIEHLHDEPVVYYSRTEIRKAAAAKGMIWGPDNDRHVPQHKGTDKSTQTTRWY